MNKYFHNLSSNILVFQNLLTVLEHFQRDETHSIFWTWILLVFKTAFIHRWRTIFNTTYETYSSSVSESIKLNFTLLLQKKGSPVQFKEDESLQKLSW